MVIVLTILWAVTAFVAICFVFESFRFRRIAQELEGENADLRGRFTVLVAEMRRLRTASGLSSDGLTPSQEDELMPIRRPVRSGARSKPVRPAEGPDSVVLVSVDSAEQRRLSDALSAAGYRTQSASLGEAAQLAHALSTAALVVDLRDTTAAVGAPALMSAFATDPLAKEVPVFALVASRAERERIIDEGPYTFAFVVPSDTAVFVSTLGAAIIRRKTRLRRAETARTLSASAARA